jgi:hypothetical protein
VILLKGYITVRKTEFKDVLIYSEYLGCKIPRKKKACFVETIKHKRTTSAGFLSGMGFCFQAPVSRAYSVTEAHPVSCSVGSGNYFCGVKVAMA